MYEFKLPDVGEGIHEAEIARWLVGVGDEVKRDQPMLEIQTDKAMVEIPAPVTGVVSEIKAAPGEIARLGQVLVLIRPESQQPPETGASNSRPAATPSGRAKGGIAGPGQRVLAAPAVRKLALELGLDLSRVSGSGPHGRILPSDVRAHAEQEAGALSPEPAQSPSPQPSPRGRGSFSSPPLGPVLSEVEGGIEGGLSVQQDTLTTEPLQGLRRRIAERMDEAWQIPHVTSFAEVEVSRLVKLRRRLQPLAAEQGVALTFLPFIIKAAIQVLKDYPYFNATLDLEKQQIIRYGHYHIGLATATEEGLVVPVIRHADRLSLRQLAQESERLAGLARQRRLSREELSGSTFTVTNFGSAGGEQGTPVINPPEAAILGCGLIEQKPVVVKKGKVRARPVLPLALSFDHRLIDGAAAARFLRQIKRLLHDPKRLILEL